MEGMEREICSWQPGEAGLGEPEESYEDCGENWVQGVFVSVLLEPEGDSLEGCLHTHPNKASSK